jgi:hypothetical protein
MTWREGLFFDRENLEEIHDDPYRCTWCRRPFDASRMHEHVPPERKIVDAILQMRAEGKTLDDILRNVQIGWESEAH